HPRNARRASAARSAHRDLDRASSNIMSIGEHIDAVESVEVDATLGLISGFERFLRLALKQPQTRALVHAMSGSRSARVAVEDRAEQLIDECLNLTEHVHPRDIALAVYVLALHEIGS